MSANPDETVTARPICCASCQDAFEFADHQLVNRYDTIELPRVKPIITRSELYLGHCQACGRYFWRSQRLAFRLPSMAHVCNGTCAPCRRRAIPIPQLIVRYRRPPGRREIEPSIASRPRAVSLFTGAGGFDEGIELAGFQILAGIEIDADARRTYRHNFAEIPVLPGDIRAFLGLEAARHRALYGLSDLDLIFGGPPCGGFSTLGPRDPGDVRNHLPSEFIRVVEELQPRMILMENVPAILFADNGRFRELILSGLRRAGYGNAAYISVRATDHGVPQYRERIFFLATRDDLDCPADLASVATAFLAALKTGTPPTVKEAIGDLPARVTASGTTLRYPKLRGVPSAFLRSMRLDYSEGPFTQEAKQRRAIGLLAPVLYHHHTKEIGARRAAIIAHLRPGDKGDSLPPDLWNGVRAGKWRRLHPDRPSHAILAHAAQDLSEFIHPLHDRWLSVRELARLQGFHDGWIFRSSESRALRQIGNAVPPALAYAVARLAMQILRGGGIVHSSGGTDQAKVHAAQESVRMAEKKLGPTNPHAEWMSLEAIDNLVKSYYGTKTLMVDQPLAEALLERYNTANRRVNQRKLAQLAAQMTSGEFENTGEPLIFSAESVLNNGQHRLMAVVASRATVEMDLRFGIPRKAFSKTDTGSARTSADVLTIKGVPHGGDVARALRLLILYKRGLPDSVREFVSNDEVGRAADVWGGIIDTAARVAAHSPPRAIRGAALLATAYLASRSPGKARLDGWLEGLATGLDLRRDDPAYLARERILRAAEAPIGTRELLLERLGMLILAWNAYAAQKSVGARDLRWRAKKGRSDEPFPAVDGGRLPAIPEAAPGG